MSYSMYFTYTTRKCVFLIKINVCREEGKKKSAGYVVVQKFRSLILHRFTQDAKIRASVLLWKIFVKPDVRDADNVTPDVTTLRTELHNLDHRPILRVDSEFIHKTAQSRLQCVTFLILFTVYSYRENQNERENGRQSEKENVPHARAPLSGKLEVCLLLKRYTRFDDMLERRRWLVIRRRSFRQNRRSATEFLDRVLVAVSVDVVF